MRRRNIKKIKLPGVANERFLLLLLKIVVHGGLDIEKLSKINVLISRLDTASYAKDVEKFSLIRSVEIAIARKAQGINDIHLIMSSIETSITHEDNKDYLKDIVEPTVTNENIVPSEHEIKYVISIISTYSKIGFLLESEDEIIDKFSLIKTGSIQGIDNIVLDFERSLKDLTVKLHKALSVEDLSTVDPVSINDPDFMKKQFRLVHEMSRRANRNLLTGLKMFNEFLSPEGGFLTGKYYLIGAPTNSFKTGLLLYIAKWIQLYNSHKYIDKFKKTGRIPTVLVISLENTWDENLERLFSMYTKKQMREIPDVDEAAEIFFRRYSETESCIDLALEFGIPNQFSPFSLERRIDELESQNRQVIAVITDYLKIMKDDQGALDTRNKVINISTDLHTIAATHPNLVMISAHHTNRVSKEIFTDGETRGIVDRVKMIGQEHMSESHQIEDPPDFTMYIYPEISPHDGERYLTFKKGKTRGVRTDLEYFAHLMEKKFFITDDLLLEKTLSLTSINETINNGRDSLQYKIKNESKPNQYREISTSTAPIGGFKL